MPELVTYRLAGRDTPLHVHPNPSANRYNLARAGPTQYLSLHPLTPWAEHLRARNARALEGLLALRIRAWALRVLVPEIADLTYDNAPEFGLDPADLVAEDMGPCQEFGDRCREDPELPNVWRVPSAALPGTRNLVIFGSRVEAGYAADPVDPEVDVPASVSADDGRALHTLLDRVRYRGTAHAEYEAWRRGRSHEFDDPPTPLLR